MDATLAATLGGVAGLGICGVAVLAFRFSEWSARRSSHGPEPAVPPDVVRVLSVLRSISIVVGPHDEVVQASASARAFGLVKGSRLMIEELTTLVRKVRRNGEIQQVDLEIARDPRGRDVSSMLARVAPISSRLMLVLVEDRTKERRLDTIRRDFVANVSHELKTPVGALTLLAEAVEQAADDSEAVQRFAGRMQVESDRLTRLVQQIIELSRVQDDDLLEEALPVQVDRVVDAALDRCRVDAQSKGIDLVRSGVTGKMIVGSEQQLLIALGNLVENAVAYSAEQTRVVVDVRTPDRSFVDISVADQGDGIPEDQLARVFERFYRVDRARSRETGGTGLGLSIVKHVAAGHGGDVKVWSVAGEGSTFTLRLPLRGAPGLAGQAAPAVGAVLAPTGRAAATVTDAPATPAAEPPPAEEPATGTPPTGTQATGGGSR